MSHLLVLSLCLLALPPARPITANVSLSPTLFLSTYPTVSVSPVAVDGDQDEDHHGDDDGWDDDGQRDVVLAGVVDGANHPLAMTKLHLQFRKWMCQLLPVGLPVCGCVAQLLSSSLYWKFCAARLYRTSH